MQDKLFDRLFGQVEPYYVYRDKRDWVLKEKGEAVGCARNIGSLKSVMSKTVAVGPPDSPFAIPPAHDFRDLFGRVRTQIGMDCSSQAILACFEQNWLRLTGKPFQGSAQYAYLISLAYQYPNRFGKWSHDFNLVSPTRVLRAFREVGCCTSEWFSDLRIDVQQDEPVCHNVLASARDHRIETYNIVDPIWIKFLLANDASIVVVVRWATDFTRPCFWSNSISTPAECIRLPEPDDVQEWKPYDHAMTLSGYNDEEGYFWARSSSSARWADNGYVQIPYSYYDGLMFGWWSILHVRTRDGVK